MAIQIKHAFTSAKGDGGDATLVRPSNWNAVHSTSMATGQLLGRLTAGVGSFEEIPLSAYIAAILNVADAPALLAALGIGAFETGDVKYSISPTAAAGWITYNGTGTIGDLSSGGTIRANADTSALFQLIWNNIPDSFCPVSGGRGANAAADFAAHKTILTPWYSGRALIGAGLGGSLSTRLVGQYFGEETHLLTTPEIPAHVHANSLNDSTHTHSLSNTALIQNSSGSGIGGGGAFGVPINLSVGAAATGVSITNASAGGGGAHNVMQPSIPMYAKVKL